MSLNQTDAVSALYADFERQAAQVEEAIVVAEAGAPKTTSIEWGKKTPEETAQEIAKIKPLIAQLQAQQPNVERLVTLATQKLEHLEQPKATAEDLSSRLQSQLDALTCQLGDAEVHYELEVRRLEQVEAYRREEEAAKQAKADRRAKYYEVLERLRHLNAQLKSRLDQVEERYDKPFESAEESAQFVRMHLDELAPTAKSEWNSQMNEAEELAEKVEQLLDDDQSPYPASDAIMLMRNNRGTREHLVRELNKLNS